jgi:RNA polymerase sigma factor (sigma-70 family)
MSKRPLAAVVRRIQHIVGVPTAATSDRQFLERYSQERSEEAFTNLVRRHGALVMGICRRILGNRADADDVFQATFLVLARKASSLSWHDSIGNWLYGVAYRLARRARADMLRRQERERRAADLPRPEPRSQADWAEMSAVLDDEMQRLPQKCRAVLVACYLEGLTRDEAARQLGWSLRTLDRRLKRGRELLRNRLIRRGITLSAGLLSANLAESSLCAAVPGYLLATASRAAVAYAAAPSLAADVPAKAAVLADELIRGLAAAKVKLLMALLLAVTVVAGVATVAYRGWSGESEQGPAPAVISPPQRPVQPKVEPRVSRINTAIRCQAVRSSGWARRASAKRGPSSGLLTLPMARYSPPRDTSEYTFGTQRLVRSCALSPPTSC